MASVPHMALAIVPEACWLMLVVTQELGLQVQISKIWHSYHTTYFDQLELLPYSDKLGQPSPVTVI